MAASELHQPRLSGYLQARLAARNAAGEDVLVFRSERRTVRLAGQALADFYHHVLPLLDGRRTRAEIEAAVAARFAPADLQRALALLAAHNLLEEGDNETSEEARAPQQNFFAELGAGRDFVRATQARLNDATVTIFGATGVGAYAALALAAAGVGTLRVCDSLPVAPADLYLAPFFDARDADAPRVEALRRSVSNASPTTRFEAWADALRDEKEVGAALAGAQFALACVDAGLSGLLYQLNRAALASGIAWTAASVSGFEVTLGPTILPGETACYLCYQMRAVACAEQPEEEFAWRQFLAERRRDESGQRENLVFAGGAAGNLLALEAMKYLTGAMPTATAGSVQIIDLLTLNTTKHTVLKKPWCPACFPRASR